MTAGIDEAMAPLRAFGPDPCLTLEEGPPGIQSQRDVTIGPMLRRAAALENDAAGFVVACFSDPGLHALRERADAGAGHAECGVLTALTLGQRFGVIAILPTSFPRHLRDFGAMGVTNVSRETCRSAWASPNSPTPGDTGAMVDRAPPAAGHDGADVLVMGCAGMARYRDRWRTRRHSRRGTQPGGRRRWRSAAFACGAPL